MKIQWFLTSAVFVAAGTAWALGGGLRTRPGFQPGIPMADYQYRDRSASMSLLSGTAILTTEPGTAAVIAVTASGATTLTSVPSVVFPPPPVVVMPAAQPTVIVERRFLRSSVTVVPAPPQIPLLPPVAAVPTSPLGSMQKLFQFPSNLVIGHCAISAAAVVLTERGTWSIDLRADQNPNGTDPASPKIAPSNMTTQLLRNEFHVEFRCYQTNQIPVGKSAAVGIGKPIVLELPPQEFWVQRGEPLSVHCNGINPGITASFAKIDRVEVTFFYYK